MSNELRVLLIDDQEFQYQMVNDFLDTVWNGHYCLDWSATYTDGKAKIIEGIYDVCLVDYELGQHSGLDLIQEMSDAENAPPMILLTGHGNRRVDLRAMEAGAVDYIDKTYLRAATLERSIRYAVERTQTLRKLRDSEAKQRHILSTVPAGVFIRQNNRFQYVNEMMGVITHYRLEELLELDLLDLIHPDLRAVVESWIPQRDVPFAPSQSETLILTKHGQERWVSLTMSPMAANETDHNPQILGAMINVTKQKQVQQMLMESERRFRALVENGSDIIIIINTEKKITYASPSLSRIFGYGEGELLAHEWLSIVHPDDQNYVRQQLDLLIQGKEQSVHFEIQIRRAQGDWRWIESVATNLLHEASIDGIVLNAHDITENKLAVQAEHEQRTLAEALLDTSATLNSTLKFDKVLTRILENVGNVIPHDTANIMLIQNGHTHIAGYSGYQNPDLERNIRRTRLNVHKQSQLREIIETHQPLLISDLLEDEHSLLNNIFNTLRSYVAAPILIKQEVIGFINLFSFTPGFFTETHAQRLQIFADQAAIAIRNARSYEQAQELATVEERQRLARDLHDAVSQTLFSASVIAETLPRLLDQDTQEVQNGLENLARMNKGALAEMRALLLELRPQALIETELPTLLQHLVNAVGSRTDAQMTLSVRGRRVSLPGDVQVAMYRIAQEALNNIIKHSRATEVTLTFMGYDERVELWIKDDGRGFVPEQIPSDHMGLRIMKERAQSADITFTLETAPGTGTLIQVTWPGSESEYESDE